MYPVATCVVVWHLVEHKLNNMQKEGRALQLVAKPPQLRSRSEPRTRPIKVRFIFLYYPQSGGLALQI